MSNPDPRRGDEPDTDGVDDTDLPEIKGVPQPDEDEKSASDSGEARGVARP